MILETLVLSGFLYKRSKKLADKLKPVEDKADGDKQEVRSIAEEKMRKMVGSQQARLAFKTQNDEALISSSAALALATTGALIYPPLSLLSVPLLIYSSQDIHKRTYKLLKEGKVGTESLISITLLGAVVIQRFFVASLICLAVRYANRLTSRITEESRAHLSSMFEQQMDTVWVLVNGVETQIPFEQLKVNDTVIVQSGEMIPADGVVIDGMARVDQHILTGEANPVERETDDEVFASTVVLSGKIYIRVEKAGADCTVAKIADILNQTVDFKSTTQLRAEKFSKDLVTPALIVSGLAFPFWGFTGALAVINAHPKNKIMIIAPLTVLNYLNLAAKNGLLIKDGRSLEILNQIDTIVFDKTGTLTEEQPHVGAIHCCPGYDETAVLRFAATAEHKQKHPLARAILDCAKQRGMDLADIGDSQCHLGYEVLVQVDGVDVHVGSARFMELSNIALTDAINTELAHCHEQGHSLVMVAVGGQLIGAIELWPTVRSEAKQVIAQLKARKNISATYIISGDHEIPTKKLADELGIDHYFAGVLPTEKADLIDKLKAEGRFVCYIGDGVNDSIALKKSHVSISLSGASTIATDTAQIVLMDQGISHLDTLFNLAEDFKRNMDNSLKIMLTPAIVGVGGVFLLGFGLPQTLFLNLAGLAFGVNNAMHPKLVVSDPIDAEASTIDTIIDALEPVTEAEIIAANTCGEDTEATVV
ncbi:MAG: heavy metal translocating P-type ATPase [Methylococcaceae bacterium]|nr:heavy metal translocating P-type ATPase [Methylococcaceae bacterium]